MPMEAIGADEMSLNYLDFILCELLFSIPTNYATPLHFPYKLLFFDCPLNYLTIASFHLDLISVENLRDNLEYFLKWVVA